MGLIRNQVYGLPYRGFESHPLRQNEKGPIRGLLHFCRVGMGFRTMISALIIAVFSVTTLHSPVALAQEAGPLMGRDGILKVRVL